MKHYFISHYVILFLFMYIYYSFQLMFPMFSVIIRSFPTTTAIYSTGFNQRFLSVWLPIDHWRFLENARPNAEPTVESRSFYWPTFGGFRWSAFEVYTVEYGDH